MNSEKPVRIVKVLTGFTLLRKEERALGNRRRPRPQ